MPAAPPRLAAATDPSADHPPVRRATSSETDAAEADAMDSPTAPLDAPTCAGEAASLQSSAPGAGRGHGEAGEGAAIASDADAGPVNPSLLRSDDPAADAGDASSAGSGGRTTQVLNRMMSSLHRLGGSSTSLTGSGAGSVTGAISRGGLSASVSSFRDRGWSMSSSASTASLLGSPEGPGDGSENLLLPALEQAVQAAVRAAARHAATRQAAIAQGPAQGAGPRHSPVRSPHSGRLSEADPEVDSLCSALEAILSHRFKTRQFMLFSVHPWSLLEHAENSLQAGNSSAESARVVSLARGVGSTDPARARAWVYAHLNRGSLCTELDALLQPALLGLMYRRGALLLRLSARDTLLQHVEALGGIGFQLGRAVGLCPVHPPPADGAAGGEGERQVAAAAAADAWRGAVADRCNDPADQNRQSVNRNSETAIGGRFGRPPAGPFGGMSGAELAAAAAAAVVKAEAAARADEMDGAWDVSRDVSGDAPINRAGSSPPDLSWGVPPSLSFDSLAAAVAASLDDGGGGSLGGGFCGSWSFGLSGGPGGGMPGGGSGGVACPAQLAPAAWTAAAAAAPMGRAAQGRARRVAAIESAVGEVTSLSGEVTSRAGEITSSGGELQSMHASVAYVQSCGVGVLPPTAEAPACRAVPGCTGELMSGCGGAGWDDEQIPGGEGAGGSAAPVKPGRGECAEVFDEVATAAEVAAADRIALESCSGGSEGDGSPSHLHRSIHTSDGSPIHGDIHTTGSALTWHQGVAAAVAESDFDSARASATEIAQGECDTLLGEGGGAPPSQHGLGATKQTRDGAAGAVAPAQWDTPGNPFGCPPLPVRNSQPAPAGNSNQRPTRNSAAGPASTTNPFEEASPLDASDEAWGEDGVGEEERGLQEGGREVMQEGEQEGLRGRGSEGVPMGELLGEALAVRLSRKISTDSSYEFYDCSEPEDWVPAPQLRGGRGPRSSAGKVAGQGPGSPTGRVAGNEEDGVQAVSALEGGEESGGRAERAGDGVGAASGTPGEASMTHSAPPPASAADAASLPAFAAAPSPAPAVVIASPSAATPPAPANPSSSDLSPVSAAASLPLAPAACAPRVPSHIDVSGVMRQDYFTQNDPHPHPHPADPSSAHSPSPAAPSPSGDRAPRPRPPPGTVNGRLVVSSAVVLGADMRESLPAKLHVVYRIRAKVGPFECTTYRRFSDFVRLHAALKKELPKLRMPKSAARLLGDRLKSPTGIVVPPAGQTGMPGTSQLSPQLSKALGPLARPANPRPEARLRLITAYCDDLVCVPELAQAEATIAFFWPSSERGDGALVAPDGSSAAMT